LTALLARCQRSKAYWNDPYAYDAYMLSEESIRQIEDAVRRVVRQELAAVGRAPRIAQRHTQPRSRSNRIDSDNEAQAIANMTMVDEYLAKIDPEDRMSRDERLEALQLRFPHFGL
jgi:hypothetical protein